jgi:hypothetical protein
MKLSMVKATFVTSMIVALFLVSSANADTIIPIAIADHSEAVASYPAFNTIDRDSRTFGVFYNDSNNQPVTGHIVYDLGDYYTICGLMLTTRGWVDDNPVHPHNVDIFYFNDGNPLNNSLIDDIEGDDDILGHVNISFLEEIKQGGQGIISFGESFVAQFVGLRINSSWETRGVGNFQFAEIEFTGTGPVPAPAPEPATMLLLGSGLVGLAGFRRKKFKK